MNGCIGPLDRWGNRAPSRTALALALAMALAPLWASAHNGLDADTRSADLAVLDTSDQLLAVLAQWERTPAAARATRESVLTRLAQRRQEQLLLLLQKNPQVALARMLPRTLRERMPASAATYVEHEVAMQGLVRAHVADDFTRHESRTIYKFMPTGAAAALELHLADATLTERLLNQWLNRRVGLVALRIGRHLLLGDRNKLQLLAFDGTASGTTDSATTSMASNPTVQGNQNTLVIMANFSDAAIPCTAADLQSRLFASGGSSLNQGYLESSGGLVSFSGKVVGPFAIGYASTGTCDPDAWSAALDSAARAAGVEPSAYARVSYAMPKNASCGWSGLASLGGTPPTRSWVQSCASTGVFTHELGHNLNFNHASTPTSEYGDYTDPMGAAMQVQFNAANRVMAGWVPASQIADVAAGGSHALSALEDATATSPRVLRLPKADTSERYYVSLRQLLGMDANLIAGYHNTVTVHRASGTMPARTVLVAALSPGQAWADPVNGIQVTHQGVTGSVATVAVGMGSQSCSPAAPVLSIAPVSQTAGAGTTLNYAVSVTNRNSAACPNSNFELSQVLPGGFAGTFATSSLTLAPGATASSNWSVASSSGVSDATYTLTASVTDSSSGMSTSALASDIVYTAPICTRSAPLISVSPASQSGVPGATLPYTVTVTNRDTAGCAGSNFNLDQVLPSGFSGAFGSASLSIAAGASASSAWSVTATSSSGSHTLLANVRQAETSAGAQAQAIATIAAADTAPPVIAITSPTAGTVLSGRSASLSATASDASGIASVAFYVDGSLLASDTTAPYTANWNLRKVASGGHTVLVRATDRAGNVATQSIAVTVR